MNQHFIDKTVSDTPIVFFCIPMYKVPLLTKIPKNRTRFTCSSLSAIPYLLDVFVITTQTEARLDKGLAPASYVRFVRIIEDIIDRIIKPNNGNIQISREYDQQRKAKVIVLHGITQREEYHKFRRKIPGKYTPPKKTVTSN